MKIRVKYFLILLISLITIQVNAETCEFYNRLERGEFDSVIKDGTYTFKSIPPTNYLDSIILFHNYDPGFYNKYGYVAFAIDPTRCSEDFKRAQLDIALEGCYEIDETVYDLIYDYNPKAKEKIDELLPTILSSSKEVSDSEFISSIFATKSLIKNLDDPEHYDGFNIIILYNYSEDFKKIIGYTNLNIQTDDYLVGYYDNYIEGRIEREALLKNDDTVYYISLDDLPFSIKKIVYVPDDTTDEQLLNVIKNRFALYGDDAIITEEGSLNDLKNKIVTESSFAISPTMINYPSEAVDKYYKVVVGNREDYFIVIKDSSKMKDLKFKTIDLMSDIMITTESKKLPFDSYIKVKEVAKEESKINKKVKLLSNKTYDIKLYSPTLKDYVTNVENGEFEVTIPLDDNYKNKDFVVYHIKADESIEKLDYKVVDDKLVFKTNSFSEFTIGIPEKEIKESPKTKSNILLLIVITTSAIISIKMLKYNKKQRLA